VFAAFTIATASCMSGWESAGTAGGAGGGPNGAGGGGGTEVDAANGTKGPAGSTGSYSPSGGGNGTTSSTTGAGGAGGGAGGGGDGGAGAGPAEQCVPDTGTARTFYMSADDSSSMGSPALAREYLNKGVAPPQAIIRTWEFLNYYHVRYPLPAGDKLGIHAHFAAGPNGTHRLQVGVQAFATKPPALSLTLVVDTSGSLVGEGIARERAAITAIAANLSQGDRINFVTWANDDAVLLANHVASGPNDPAFLAAIQQLIPGGGSDLHAGLTLGYALAKDAYDTDRLNRVVLISDGGANLGIVDRDLIAAEAKNGDDLGIYMVGVGVGPALGYSDALMNLVTDMGRGSYVYLDSMTEAKDMLGGRFHEVMDIAARGVQVAVTLPSYFDIQTFYGEKYSQDMNDIQPQHMAPQDSMIFNELLSVCPGCEVCPVDAVEVRVDWSDPALHETGAENFTIESLPLQSLTGEPWQLLKSEAIIAYAEALKHRRKADFAKATTAVAAAVTAVADAAKDPAIVDDDFPSELADIATLLASFPEADKID